MPESFPCPGEYYPEPSEADLASVASSSQLDPLESSCTLDYPDTCHCHIPPAEFAVEPSLPLESTFRHAGWMPNRRRCWAALIANGVRGARLDRFRECGSGLWLHAGASSLSLRCNCCRDRWCQPCQRANAHRLMRQIESVIDPHDTRFVTLTLRHSNTPLTDQIDRLYRSFLLLRRKAVWKDAAKGCIAILEVKLSSRDGCWHPHLHCLVKGLWMDQRELSKAWHAITGDSSIVDIRPIHQAKEVSTYVTKYLSKPVDQSVFIDQDKLQEAMLAMKSRRSINTSGCWRGVKLRLKATDHIEGDDAPKDEQPIGRVAHILTSNDPAMARWRDAIFRKWPRLAAMIQRSIQENSS